MNYCMMHVIQNSCYRISNSVLSIVLTLTYERKLQNYWVQFHNVGNLCGFARIQTNAAFIKVVVKLLHIEIIEKMHDLFIIHKIYRNVLRGNGHCYWYLCKSLASKCNYFSGTNCNWFYLGILAYTYKTNVFTWLLANYRYIHNYFDTCICRLCE